MIISVPEFGENPAKTTGIFSNEQGTEQVADEVAAEAHDKVHDKAHDLSETELAILNACRSAPQCTPELLNTLGYTSRTGHFKKAMLRLEKSLYLLEKTLPDAPRSKNQKYRLTEKGKKMVTGRES